MRPMNRRLSSLGLVFLLCVVLISAIGCGRGGGDDTSAKASTAPESKTFTDHDFSFQYPMDYLVWQDGLLDDEPGRSSGLIQVSPDQADLPLFAISWVRTWEYGLEGGLDAGFEALYNWEGIGAISKGETVTTTKSGQRMLYQKGHRMLYQYYTGATEKPDEIVYGVVGTFYCPETQRAFSLVTMQSAPDGNYRQSAVAEFESYVNSFICHQ